MYYYTKDKVIFVPWLEVKRFEIKLHLCFSWICLSELDNLQIFWPVAWLKEFISQYATLVKAWPNLGLLCWSNPSFHINIYIYKSVRQKWFKNIILWKIRNFLFQWAAFKFIILKELQQGSRKIVFIYHHHQRVLKK